MSAKNPEERVTVLLFKDHLAPRSFSIPLRWLARLSASAGFLALFLIFSLAWGAKNFLSSRSGDPGRVRLLEEEIGSLKATHQSLNQTIKDQQTELEKRTSITPSVTPPVTTDPIKAVTSPITADAGSALFKLMPPIVQSIPDPATLPIRVDAPTLKWEGTRLQVYFPIHYTKGDERSQQGRIVMLARGPGKILAYPSLVFNAALTGPLILPERGEFFSVSKFRETKASFDAVSARSDLESVDILIFDSTGALLHWKTTPLPQIQTTASPARRSAPPAPAVRPPEGAPNP